MGAWQPFTGAGLAAFGHGSASRLLFCQLFFVALGAIAVGVGVRQAWFTTVVQSERSLPDGTAEIRAGRLTWPDREPRALGETPQFALTVDPTSQGALGQVADLQLELRESALRIRGVAGFIEIPYGENWRIPLDRIGGKAQWQAWAWVIQGLAGNTPAAWFRQARCRCGQCAGWGSCRTPSHPPSAPCLSLLLAFPDHQRSGPPQTCRRGKREADSGS